LISLIFFPGLSELPPPTSFTYASCDYPKCSEHDVIIKTLYICIDPALVCMALVHLIHHAMHHNNYISIKG